jgi:hypothetical protein
MWFGLLLISNICGRCELCDTKRPEDEFKAAVDTAVEAIELDDVNGPDQEEKERRDKMDCVRNRLVTTEVQFVESAAGLSAAVACKETEFAQKFAVDCLPQVLDIFVNLKVSTLHPHSWPALKTMWQRNGQVGSVCGRLFSFVFHFWHAWL